MTENCNLSVSLPSKTDITVSASGNAKSLGNIKLCSETAKLEENLLNLEHPWVYAGIVIGLYFTYVQCVLASSVLGLCCLWCASLHNLSVLGLQPHC